MFSSDKACCDDEDRFGGGGLVIGDRYFVPNYGYTFYEYK
jgi:hypothetical protein